MKKIAIISLLLFLGIKDYSQTNEINNKTKGYSDIKNVQKIDLSTETLSPALWTIVENESGDDGAAIQTALNSNAYVSLRPNTTYNFSVRITIPENTTLQIPSGCTLLFSGSSNSQTAIEMHNLAALVGDGTLKLDRNLWNMSNQKIGVQIAGSKNKIEFGTIEGFEIGLYMSYSPDGNGWNNLYLRRVYDCVIGLVMYAGSSWVNQNYFHADYMDECRTSSDSAAKAIWEQYSIGIKMDSYGNTNTFSGSIEGYNVGIQLMGKFNRIEGVRLENCKTKIRIVGTGGQEGTEHNYLYSPYGEIYDLTGTHNGVTAIKNETGDPLYSVLDIFGFDHITYVDKFYSSVSLIVPDSKFKKDISDITGALNKVLALRGTSYKLESDEKSGDTLKKFGFIAQEIKEVLPELVEKNPLDGMYTVNYDGVIPVLVEAFKEQEKLMEQKEKDIDELRKINLLLIEILKQKGILNETELDTIKNEPYLLQNVPNPYNSETEIGFYLPSFVNDAYILVTDMNGKTLKKIEIYSRGNNKITIKANVFCPGLYLYTLIANNKVIDTKRMVLIE